MMYGINQIMKEFRVKNAQNLTEVFSLMMIEGWWYQWSYQINRNIIFHTTNELSMWVQIFVMEKKPKTWLFFGWEQTRTVVWFSTLFSCSGKSLIKNSWTQWINLFYLCYYIMWCINSNSWWCLGINVWNNFEIIFNYLWRNICVNFMIQFLVLTINEILSLSPVTVPR